MVKWWGHLRTINAHKRLVMKYCFKVGLYRQGLLPRPVQVQPGGISGGGQVFLRLPQSQ